MATAIMSKASAKSKQMRFKVGAKPEKEDVAQYQTPKERGAGSIASLPSTSWLKKIVRVLDQVLEAINRPFENVGEQGRKVLGLIALMTTIISLLAIYLMPKILPNRDAVVFLQERIAELHAPTPEAETESVEETADSEP